VECTKALVTKGPIAETNTELPFLSSIPPMAVESTYTTHDPDFFTGSGIEASTDHVTISMASVTANLFDTSARLSSSTTSTEMTTTTTTTTSTSRTTTSTTMHSTTISTTTLTTTTTRGRRRTRPTRRTRLTRPHSTSTTTGTTTTTTTKRRRFRPTDKPSISQSTSGEPVKEGTWILPEVENQDIEISDLEVDPSLEEYLYTTQSNPTFKFALDTLRDWAINRKVETVILPKIDVRSRLNTLTREINSLTNQKH